MKILLTGKDGQVGYELYRSLSSLGEVIPIGRADVDLTNLSGIEALLEEIRPQVIVNSAAYTDVDKAETEPDIAHAVNALAPRLLAEWAAAHGTFLVHYSTDHVFDGMKKGAYTEIDVPNPQNVYGKSKYAGECYIQSSGAKYLILRTSWVFGIHGRNFVKKILQKASEYESLYIVEDQNGAPTSAPLIADITALLIREATRPRADSFSYGIYHLVADGETSWYRYACHIVRHAHKLGWPLKTSLASIYPVPSSAYPSQALRPFNSRLSNCNLKNTFDIFLPNWSLMLDHILDCILKSAMRHDVL